MPEGSQPSQNDIQPEKPKVTRGYELKPNTENAEHVGFMQENSRPGGEQPWSTGRLVTNETADAQIAAAMEKLKSQVSAELFSKVEQAAMKPDGDAFKVSVAAELRAAIGEEAFNQFNADTTVSRPLDLSTLRGASPKEDRNRPSNQANLIEDRYLNTIGYRPPVSRSDSDRKTTDDMDYDDRGER